MQHLGPRRAHPRALAGGENDCQTCADLKMKGDHKTPLLYARRSLARIADRNAYSHKFEKLLARNLAGPLREFKQALRSRVTSADRIETGKAVCVKTPQRELTCARLSSIEIKRKPFLNVRRDQAPAKPNSWSSA